MNSEIKIGNKLFLKLYIGGGSGSATCKFKAQNLTCDSEGKVEGFDMNEYSDFIIDTSAISGTEETLALSASSYNKNKLYRFFCSSDISHFQLESNNTAGVYIDDVIGGSVITVIPFSVNGLDYFHFDYAHYLYYDKEYIDSLDNDVVHISGEETVTGKKTFNGAIKSIGYYFTDNLYLSHNGVDIVAQGAVRSKGQNIDISAGTDYFVTAKDVKSFAMPVSKTVVSSNTTLSMNKEYCVNTNNSAVTVTLPSSAKDGDWITLYLYGTNVCTINQSDGTSLYKESNAIVEFISDGTNWYYGIRYLGETAIK